MAKELGVSSATISRALNMEKGVTEETRQRVVTLAKELNYQPNLQAKGLVARKTNSIGVIIPQTAEFAFANTFYSEVLKGIIKAANKADYFILLSLAEREDYAKSYRRSLTSGLIVIVNRLDDPKLKALENMGIPIVLTPGYLDREIFHSVDVDNKGGFSHATSFLTRLGHNKIGLIDGPRNSKISIERKAGYLSALKENGYLQREDWIFAGDFSQEAGVRGIQAFLNHRDPPTAMLTPL